MDIQFYYLIEYLFFAILLNYSFLNLVCESEGFLVSTRTDLRYPRTLEKKWDKKVDIHFPENIVFEINLPLQLNHENEMEKCKCLFCGEQTIHKYDLKMHIGKTNF